LSQKNPIISGSFAKNDLQLKASYGSLPPCITNMSPPETQMKEQNTSCHTHTSRPQTSHVTCMSVSTHTHTHAHTQTREPYHQALVFVCVCVTIFPPGLFLSFSPITKYSPPERNTKEKKYIYICYVTHARHTRTRTMTHILES